MIDPINNRLDKFLHFFIHRWRYFAAWGCSYRQCRICKQYQLDEWRFGGWKNCRPVSEKPMGNYST